RRGQVNSWAHLGAEADARLRITSLQRATLLRRAGTVGAPVSHGRSLTLPVGRWLTVEVPGELDGAAGLVVGDALHGQQGRAAGLVQHAGLGARGVLRAHPLGGRV